MNFLNFSTPSNNIDGTEITKDSERIINTYASVVYWILVAFAILHLLGGIIALFYSFTGRFAPEYNYSDFSNISVDYNYGTSILIGFGLLIVACVIAALLYVGALLFKAMLNTICNMSLSLKVLALNAQPVQQSDQPTTNSGTTLCPECGSPVSQGIKFCAKCGYPLEW